MKSTIFLVLILFLIFSGCSRPEYSDNSNVVAFESEDETMNSAMQTARKNISVLIDKLKNPSPKQETITLKVRFEDRENVEHMWIRDVSYDGKHFTGILDNKPVNLTNISYGQEVSVPLSRVSDWMIIEDGELIGGYTIKAMQEKLAE